MVFGRNDNNCIKRLMLLPIWSVLRRKEILKMPNKWSSVITLHTRILYTTMPYVPTIIALYNF